MWKFLDKIGLKTLLEKLKLIFASKKEVNQVVEETNLYVLEIDYDKEIATGVGCTGLDTEQTITLE